MGGYREQFVQAEDVDLWLRMAEKGHLLLKMPEPLLLYRLHGESLTMKRNAEQKRCHRWVMACAEARRKGRAEPSLADFLRAEKRSAPWPVRLHALRQEVRRALSTRRRPCTTPAGIIRLLRPACALPPASTPVT